MKIKSVTSKIMRKRLRGYFCEYVLENGKTFNGKLTAFKIGELINIKTKGKRIFSIKKL